MKSHIIIDNQPAYSLLYFVVWNTAAVTQFSKFMIQCYSVMCSIIITCNYLLFRSIQY